MCPYCQSENIAKCGFFKTRSHSVQRFRCRVCVRRFSAQTGTMTYREKKPHVNQLLFRMLCQGVSQRSCAALIGIHPITVARKICRMGLRARQRLEQESPKLPDAAIVVFDEMETFEHTKCKPLSIAIAVEEGTRRILAVEVAKMPAKGPLAAISRRRYGKRKDHRPKALARMFARIKDVAPNLQEIKSDESPRYPGPVKGYLPGVRHTVYKGRRGCVVGQGELKRGGWDPLFSLNHTCAMLRDHLKRLSRRTWCTTKRPDRLQLLVDLYAWFHNEMLRGGQRLVRI